MKNPIIIAVPELLNMLDVSGCIITADAMSCQKVITEKITEKEADYVLGLKENHPAFCKEVEEYFDATQKEPQNYSDIKANRP
ncbi:MAG: ISAs1 family transposase [Oscillospiraceae bacterium]